MTRPGALAVALGLALATAPSAVAQVMPPAPGSLVVAPLTARVDSSTVRLVSGRMVRDLHVVIPGGGDGVATINWQAYGGSRSSTRLARIAHGRAVVPIRAMTGLFVIRSNGARTGRREERFRSRIFLK